MKILRWIGIWGLLILWGAACVESPKVVQGAVQSYQAESKILVVKDERPPNPELSLSVQGAEIGPELSWFSGNWRTPAFFK